jgi:uncharacterized RmlC-like cupin family protein
VTPTASTPVLQRCVRDVEAFVCAWGIRPLHIAQADATAFADVLDLDAVDEFISSAPRPPTIRMVIDGRPLPATQFCGRLRLGGRVLDDVVDAAKVAACLRDGATVVLQSLHRTWPTVGRLVAGLQAEIGHPVQANAYLTPPGAAGLARHEDGHDVLVLQLHGSKRWSVSGLGEVELRPGDVMYVPAHTPHSARTNDDPSLHLTLGIIRVRVRDVVERILADDRALDTPLPIGYRSGPSELLADLLRNAISQAGRTLVGADAAHVARTEQQRRLVSSHRPGMVASALAVATITPQSLLSWVSPDAAARRLGDAGWQPLRTVCRPEDLGADVEARIELRLDARVVTIPGTALAAVCRLSEMGEVRVADLPGLDDASRIVLARRLVEEAACVVSPS